jgi:membrane associated rhomboid family serine protease
MIISLIYKRICKKCPIISILLISGCLITTLPQFFLNDYYNQITGNPFQFQIYWGSILSSFSHTPEILAAHLLFNLIIIVFMGFFIESVLGSNTFAFISLITLISTNVINLFRESTTSHGASGICWGYLLIVFYFIIVIYERYRWKNLRKDLYFWIYVILMVFCFIGINLIEVLIMKQGFFENFGQTIHLISIVVLIPFLLIKRKDIEDHVVYFFNNEKQIIGKGKLSIIIFVLLMMLNLSATVFSVVKTITTKELTYSIYPQNNQSVQILDRDIIITFSKEMVLNSEKLENVSVFSIDEKLDWNATWIDKTRMKITLSRKPVENEIINLNYEVKSMDGFILNVILNYK